MKIMSTICRIVNKNIDAPIIDEYRLVERHPKLIRFFDVDDQERIAAWLWDDGKITREQAIALCSEAESLIEAIIAYREAEDAAYSEVAYGEY